MAARARARRDSKDDIERGETLAPLLGQLVRVAGGGVGHHAGDAYDRPGQQPR